MKNFLAVYLGSDASLKASGWLDLDEAEQQERRKQGTEAWKHWAEANKAAIVEMGTPLGKTTRVSKQGIEGIKNAMTAFTIVRADSSETAARMFDGHPHFMIFPGDSVEIMDCLPMPGEAS